MSEKEYIEREVVLKYLYNSLSFCENELDMGDFRRGCIAAIQDDIGNISNIPTADVAEVKHGEWKVEEYPKQNKKYLICRNCTAVIDCNEIRIDENEFDFCPYCGAYMRGEQCQSDT